MNTNSQKRLHRATFFTPGPWFSPEVGDHSRKVLGAQNLPIHFQFPHVLLTLMSGATACAVPREGIRKDQQTVFDFPVFLGDLLFKDVSSGTRWSSAAPVVLSSLVSRV